VTPEQLRRSEAKPCDLTLSSGAVLRCLTDHRAHPTADHFYVHPGIPKETRR